MTCSKREAVTAQTKEFRVAVTRGLDACDELMCSVRAADRTTLGVVLMSHRHSGPRGFTNVERRAVTTEHFHGGPFGRHRNRRRRVRRKFICGVNDLSTHDRENGLDAFDLLVRYGKIIVRERDEVGQLSGGDGTLLCRQRQPSFSNRRV